MAWTGGTGAPARISARYRGYLALKGTLLALLCAVFVALTAAIVAGGDRHWAVRVLFGPVFLLPAAFLGWTTALAFADVARGEARRIAGARPLASRRSGVSFQLPDGHYAEFVLHNPWGAPRQDRTYTVTVGRHSGVLVAPPEEEPAPQAAGDGPQGGATQASATGEGAAGRTRR